ncbi:enoyl-CoA hydratase/isomerase family protein [Streptomyces sp. NBC_01727]|uniref:enoyl-CoA hydratase/isomerase family protein n=1 Tax=Streptomyces sp. NBC_01727 TaxID=2975924 RepID=UPI002E0EA380|nr:enoyl-CoA hydratase-related protein [Streptomyces sp. NBC_01727]
MSEDYVAVGRDGAIATVRIDRPNAYNALNAAILRRLGDAIAALAETGEVRAIVLTGTGDKAFSAGADLDELAGLSADEATPLMRAGQEVIRSIEQCPVPVIAAVNGLALGGGFELVLACSFAVASTRAAFALPEAGLGLIPGYGGTQRLARVVGPAVARHAMLTGHRFDAERAYHLGITVLPPAEPSDLIPAALEMASEVARRGPDACRAILNAVDVGLDSTLDIGLALETQLAAMAIGGTESTEGVAAFRQRRTPKFEVKA